MTRPEACRRSIQTCLFIGLLTGVAVAREKPEAPSKEDEWYIVEMQGQRCGYMHSTMDMKGDEVHSRAVMSMKISRGPVQVEVKMDQRYREALDGQPLGFAHEMTMGRIPVRQTGTITGGKIKLVSEQEGAKKSATYDFDPEIKFTWGQILEQRKRGLTPGTSFTLKGYEPSLRVDGPVEMTFKVHGEETVDVLGKQEKLNKVTATLQMTAPIVTETWVDDEARPIVTNLNLGGIHARIVKATKEEAMKEVGVVPEMFMTSLVGASKKIPKDAKAVTLRLSVPKGGDKLPDIPNTEMQTFKRTNDYEGLLTIRRLDWKAIERAKENPADKEKMKEFLQALTMLDIQDKRIQRLAKRAVRGKSTPAEKADALREYVTDYVNEKGLDIGFATATEVARNREGDCSEHGVLLAALARASGLPARGVSGLVQVPWSTLPDGQENAFGYHMWTQVYIDGEWVDIDAAMRQTDCDPTHIALSLLPLNDEGMMNALTTMLPLFGRLKIDVESMDSKGAAVRN